MFVVNFSFKIQYFYMKYDIHNQPGWVEIIRGKFYRPFENWRGNVVRPKSNLKHVTKDG